MSLKKLLYWTLPLTTIALFSCGDKDNNNDPEEADAADVVDEAVEDTDTDIEDTDTDIEDTDTDIEDTDAEEDTDTGIEWPDPLDFELNWPIFDQPSDSLAELELDSCAVYQEEMCSPNGHRLRCDIFDVGAGEFNNSPDEMLERAYLYDRWYDLYMQPDGQTAERLFTEMMPPGTPEEVWADPENFLRWEGHGDSTLWTGTALNAYILRYLHTGTEADYQRMEAKTWAMLHFFDITGIPGYVGRHHYLLVPEETPMNHEHEYRTSPSDDDHRDIVDPESMSFLPDDYFEEHTNPNGETWTGTPRWSGDPSIDQMNGPMVAFPMVYNLLRDEDLKEQIVHQMTCYLHRLRRIELTNLQENPDALDAFQQVFAGNQLNIDPDDIDFKNLDTIVMYVHPQINTANEDEYDMECGSFIQTEPWRVIDASSRTFMIDVLNLVQDVSRPESRENQINHFYIPSIRGGDAVHMMHLSLMAYAFTGDERYADFLRNELLGDIRTAEVADTMSALINPYSCRRFYGTNIVAGPLWAINNLLADSELGTHMQEVMFEELWMREARDINNINVALMFAAAVSDEISGEERQAAIDFALAELATFGGNGDVLNDPRRNYYRSFDDTVAAMPEGIESRCPTEEERAFCEREIVVFGTSLPTEDISEECDDTPGQCVMEAGDCTMAESNLPLPATLREWADYTWQRNPFDIGNFGSGNKQSPGIDYTEQYWMARFFGFIEESPQVLAWQELEETCEE